MVDACTGYSAHVGTGKLVCSHRFPPFIRELPLITPSDSTAASVTGLDQLTLVFAAGEKPVDKWRIGTEHEKFCYDQKTLRPVPFDGECGIEALLRGLGGYGWTEVLEAGRLIGLTRDGANVSLEPAGQLELSGAPLAHVHATYEEIQTHLNEAKAVGEGLGIGFLGVGFHPSATRAQMPWMPKARYRIMRNYMPKVGTLGLDMMTRTSTVQVNLDYSSEADMVKKFRVSLALQPVATALFADSPFTEGRPNGFQSYRSHIWTDTDDDRTGMLDFVFEDGFGYERYTEYLLDVPMYFVYRDGVYHDVSGQSFRDFLRGKLPGLPGELPTLRDWSDHMTTAFPEVRLKQYLEMRGADSGSKERLAALSAFWVGLMYDQAALDAAWDLVKGFTHDERNQMRDDVPRQGLSTPTPRGSMQQLAQQVLEIAAQGLRRRTRCNASGQDEQVFLAPLQEIADSGQSAASRKLELFHGEWDGQVDRVFAAFSY